RNWPLPQYSWHNTLRPGAPHILFLNVRIRIAYRAVGVSLRLHSAAGWPWFPRCEQSIEFGNCDNRDWHTRESIRVPKGHSKSSFLIGQMVLQRIAHAQNRFV